MFKRISLFLLTNILVIATVSIVTSVLGLHNYLTSYGIDYGALAAFCAVWGMAGSIIALFMSKFTAKFAMGVQIISPDNANIQQRALLDQVYRLAQSAGLQKMPEVGVYDSPDLNAFATGPTKNNALVAVSSGLLNAMSEQEREGVLGHEISHVANGDMVTMMLLQGVVNAFALFLSRVIAYAISAASNRNSENNTFTPGASYYLLSIVFDILLTILGSLVVAAFSRYREYRADAGGARLAGRNNMIAALQKLRALTEKQVESESEDQNRAPSLAMLKINHRSNKLFSLWMTHPPLLDRIKRLQEGA
jgi:heat shock protein HtpX